MLNCGEINFDYWESIFPNHDIICFGIDNANHSPNDIQKFLMTYLDLKQNYLVIVRYNQVNWNVYYSTIANESREGLAVFFERGAIAYSNWYEHNKENSSAFANHEIEEIRCRCHLPYFKQETPPKLKSDIWDKIDSNIHIMYVSQICSEESKSIQQRKSQQIGELTLAYMQYYEITKEFTYTWHCIKMDDNYSWTYYKQPNELMIFLLPNNVVLKDLEHPCGLVEFQSNEIYIYQTCHVKRPIGYLVSHELSHWILFQKYPMRPDIFSDWVHNTQDCWDSGRGCQDNLIVNGIPYTIMPKYS